MRRGPIDALSCAVMLLSVAMLAFQVLQAAVLSLQLLPEAGFLAVSVSMLGLGAGGSLAILLERRAGRRSPERRLWTAAAAFAVAIVASMVATSWSHAVAPIVLAAFVPYVFAGLFLATVFAMRPERATVVYCFDLVGAALGCVLIVVLLDRVGDAGVVVLVVGAVAAAAAAVVGLLVSVRRVAAALVLMVALLGLAPFRSGLFAFGPQPLKFFGKLLAKGPAAGVLERQRWNHLGRLDAFVPGPAIADFDYTKDVPQLLAAGCRFRLLFSNGYNWTYTIAFPPGSPLREGYFGGWAQHLPYAFLERPDVLVLGSGGGPDMYFAQLNGARTITGVEINPLMIEAARDWAPDAWDGLWTRPGVDVVALDARTFVQTTANRYDVVSLNAVDTGGTQTSLIATNFLYTQEAFAEYLRVLEPDGVIFLTRPREQLLRALTAAVAALRLRGAARPEEHVAVVGGGELSYAAVYATRLGSERVAALRARLGTGAFTGTAPYLPGLAAEPNAFAAYFEAVAADREAAHLATGPRLLTPTTDDQPYFYQLDRDFLRSDAGRLLRTILLLVVGLGAVLIFVPLLGEPMAQRTRRTLVHLVYFACLGTGFMLIEIGLMTKLALYLGHPARSLTVTLATLLLASGVGSLLAGRLGPRILPVVLATIAVAALLLGPMVDALAVARFGNPAVRIGVTVAVLAPVGLALGMPFPLRLRALASESVTLVPWAWAVNGFASVGGSVVAVMIAMSAGFRATFAVAAACYAAALLAERLARIPASR
jgi:SAM-dependent methyltransferase